MISRNIKVSRQDAEKLRKRGLISRFQLAVPGMEIDLGPMYYVLAYRILNNVSKVWVLVDGSWIVVTCGNIDTLGKYFGETVEVGLTPVVEDKIETPVEEAPVEELTEADDEEEPVITTADSTDEEPVVVEAPKAEETELFVDGKVTEDGSVEINPETNLVQEVTAEEPAKKISVSKKNKKKK